MIEYRQAVKSDLPDLYTLFQTHFYLPPYFLTTDDPFIGCIATADGTIVGAAKLQEPSVSLFDDWEIQFVAVYEKYRKQGIAEQLILHAIEDLHGKIYGSGWRTWDTPNQAHIHTVLIKLGFRLEEMGYKHWDSKHFCKYSGCWCADNKEHPTCECWEDIYVLDKA